MKRVALVTLLVVIAAVAYRSFAGAETGTGTLTLPQPAPNVGQKAPDFVAKNVAGKTFKLSDKGTYVLAFWDSLNMYSTSARPGFTRLAKEFKGSGVSFAVVYAGNAPQKADAAPYTVLQDSSGNLTSLYNVKRVPRLFLIQDGKIKLVQNGYTPENDKYLKKALEKSLSRGNPDKGSKSS